MAPTELSQPPDEHEPVISHVASSLRYEAHVGDRRAGLLTYRLRDGRMILVHTEVDPDFEGRGIAARLVAAALADARAHDRRVVPACPYAASYLRRHPDELDLVDEVDRAEYLT